MGYNTHFTGQVSIDPPLNPTEIEYLNCFSEARHEDRPGGPYQVRDFATPTDLALTRQSVSFPVERSYWCQWVPSEDGTALAWDEEEKFYEADLWLAYLVDTFLKPGAALVRELAEPVPGRVYPEEFARFTFDHVVNGVIEAQGEEEGDRWRIEVRDNVVYTVHHRVEPAYDDIDPRDPGEWGDAQWDAFQAAVRSNVAYVVRDGQRHEVDPSVGLTVAPVE